MATKVLIVIISVTMLCGTLHAQEESDEINSNMGVALSLPLGPTSQTVHTSWGLVGGIGYNFSDHHSIVNEFMWSALYPSSSALEPLRITTGDNSIKGHSNLYTITGNYRYEMRGAKLGAYIIAGGGWYYRTIGLSKLATSGSGSPCTPAWKWWGFSCTSGMVTPNQTMGSYNSSAFGGNFGAGLTINVGEPSYRVYIEPRYHYAPTKNIATHLLEITVGIRY